MSWHPLRMISKRVQIWFAAKFWWPHPSVAYNVTLVVCCGGLRNMTGGMAISTSSCFACRIFLVTKNTFYSIFGHFFVLIVATFPCLIRSLTHFSHSRRWWRVCIITRSCCTRVGSILLHRTIICRYHLRPGRRFGGRVAGAILQSSAERLATHALQYDADRLACHGDLAGTIKCDYKNSHNKCLKIAKLL